MSDRPKKAKKRAPAPPPPPPPQEPEKSEKRAADDALLSQTATKISASAGIVAAMVLATLVNIFVARHYRRWDLTRGGLYTLSEATTATLRGLDEPVKIIVLLPGGEALTLSVQHLLDSYRAESSKLEIEYLDPDRKTADFLALAQRYGLTAEREDGRVVPSAAAIVVRGERREILRQRDLVEIEGDDDLRGGPRLEQAFTAALRAVTTGDRPKACFSAGHGEIASEALREHLLRSGFVVESVEPARAGEDKGALDGCKVLVVAGPSERVPSEDAARYKAYLEKGGAAFFALGVREENADRGFVDSGLGEVLGGYGLALDQDLVFELDPRFRSARGRGDIFAAAPRPHPVTQSLLKKAELGLLPVLAAVSSVSATGSGNAAVTPLLATSDQAFGMVDFAAWAKRGAPALPSAADKRGPLHIAYAAERSGPPGEAHKGRLVVIGSVAALDARTWRVEDTRGTAIFVESAIAWLSARPPILDIPQKPTFTAGLRVSDEWLQSTFRYVVVYLPLTSMLLGVAVYLRRRGEKRAPRVPKEKP
jgi:hypothetical protein